MAETTSERRLARGRSLAEFSAYIHSDGDPLYPAERRLLEAAREGEVASVGKKRPARKNPNKLVRAEFLRFLCLGGDENTPIHERGLHLEGGWIDGDVNLMGCNIPQGLYFWRCWFDGAVVIRSANLRVVSFDGSRIAGLIGDGATIAGGLYLRNGFLAEGLVRIHGARVSESLICTNARFDGQRERAFSADRIKVAGNLCLDGDFEALGAVRIGGGVIEGSVLCRGGLFDNPDGVALQADGIKVGGSIYLDRGFRSVGEVRFPGGSVDRDFSCQHGRFANPGGIALRCDGATIGGAFFLAGDDIFAGGLSLHGVHTGTLIDELPSWPRGSFLDGFVYERFAGYAPTDAVSRIAWLQRQNPNDIGLSFKPQPWEQLVKTLKEMGHDAAARRVAVEKQHMLRKVGKYSGVGRALHSAFGFLADYGYSPLKLVGWSLGVWLICGCVYWYAMAAAIMAPTNPLVFQNTTYASCMPKNSGNWATCDAAPFEYTTFEPFFYSLDLILPLVDLQQDRDWSPMVQKPRVIKTAHGDYVNVTKWWRKGLIVRGVVWFEILYGWVASLMLAAVLSGLAKQDSN